MTSIKLTVTGAEAWASVNGILTSGMVGIPVTMEYDSVWNGLRKNLVCRCSPWNSDEGEYRSILNVGEAATVAHEVMQPNMYLYLGVEGYRDDGTLIIPTIWAKCGKIEYGANTCDDPTTNPELSVWNQLLAEMEQIRQDVITPELVAEIKGYAQSATKSAANAERAKDQSVAASNEALSNAAAARYAADTAQESSDSARTSASSAANLANGALQAQKAAEAAAERAEAAADSGMNVSAVAIDYDKNVKAVAHRGYSTEAPENTIPAYILAKQKGFGYAECDVSFTSDGVAVLLHDSTIDRTSDGSGSISSLTYAEVSRYDFGSWKSADYAGTRIPTFAEFISTCKAIGLHPYIELKSNGDYTEEQIAGIVAAVKAHGMAGKVTYISFNAAFLGYVKNADPFARLGYLANNVNFASVSDATALKTDSNEVYLGACIDNLNVDGVNRCIDADLPLEIWTVNNESIIQSMNPYITGVTSDYLIAGKILYEAGMQYTPGDDTGGDAGGGSGGDDSGDSGDDVLPEQNRTLLYSWDLMKSLTDTVSGVTAVTNATQGSTGVVFDAPESGGGHYIDFGAVYATNRTFEIDVASMALDTTASPHARLFAVDNDPDTGAGGSGFVFHSGLKKWKFYAFGTGWMDETVSGADGFSGKTVAIKVDANRMASVHVDGVQVLAASEPFPEYTAGHAYIGGSVTDALYNVTISGFRVYEGTA